MFSAEGELRYLVHRTEDVTDFVRLSLRGEQGPDMEQDALRRGQSFLQATNTELREAVRLRDESLALAARSQAEVERQRASLHAVFMQAPTALHRHVGDDLHGPVAALRPPGRTPDVSTHRTVSEILLGRA
ncbi:MAG TPA: hypothetical protein VFZ09_17120 [Archangium sp.]|uniref:hypothetical protein n=1 Tax=Archangium sp. TaxID=1872627 RepID=UPI002E34A0A2|nr:hypothetical protein [Archangium sp.]HEX5747966.1 hypothetical protein [Archangium sp.]